MKAYNRGVLLFTSEAIREVLTHPERYTEDKLRQLLARIKKNVDHIIEDEGTTLVDTIEQSDN